MNFAWQDRALMPRHSVHIDPSDRGFLLGDGVFETMRLHEGRVLRLDRHLARLARGAALLHIPLPEISLLHHALDAVIAANSVPDAALRLTLSRGAGPRGLLPPPSPNPTFLITQSALAPPLGPCRLHVSRYRRDGASPLSQIKHLNYLPQILARIDAEQAGCDDALLMAADGHHIAEASAATLIVFCGGERLHTPPVDDGALAGTAREALIESGLCIEQRLTLEDLYTAQGAWLVNSLSVREIHGVGTIVTGRAPDWTSRLAHRLDARLP